MKQHGGKRQGAGRPKKENTVIKLSVSLPAELWKRIDKLRLEGEKDSHLLARLLREI